MKRQWVNAGLGALWGLLLMRKCQISAQAGDLYLQLLSAEFTDWSVTSVMGFPNVWDQKSTCNSSGAVRRALWSLLTSLLREHLQWSMDWLWGIIHSPQRWGEDPMANRAWGSGSEAKLWIGVSKRCKKEVPVALPTCRSSIRMEYSMPWDSRKAFTDWTLTAGILTSTGRAGAEGLIQKSSWRGKVKWIWFGEGTLQTALAEL